MPVVTIDEVIRQMRRQMARALLGTPGKRQQQQQQQSFIQLSIVQDAKIDCVQRLSEHSVVSCVS